MSLKLKASRVSLANLDDEPIPTPQDVGAPDDSSAIAAGIASTDLPGPSSVRKARSGVAAISERIGAQQKVQDLEDKVAEYEAGGVLIKIAPKLIRESNWKNRHELSYATAGFSLLRAEIEGAGGNVQPIKVRRLTTEDKNGCLYEIVYGRRRLRACLELGLDVSAVIEEMSDLEAFQAMERENRNREDLSAWEQGVMYKDAMDKGLFSSQRQMAAALGLNQSNLSKSIRLASLPKEIVAAFTSPLDLQFRWSAELPSKFESDPQSMLRTAATICAVSPRPSARVVYELLIGAEDVAHAASTVGREFDVAGRRAASLKRDANGQLSLKIKPGVLSAGKERKLLEFLERLFE